MGKSTSFRRIPKYLTAIGKRKRETIQTHQHYTCDEIVQKTSLRYDFFFSHNGENVV